MPLLTDELPKDSKGISREELRASHIADAILKTIITKREAINAVRDAKYNPQNGSILFVMYPSAEPHLQAIINRAEKVLGVERVYDNVLSDDITGEKFHVLKVMTLSKEEEEQQKETEVTSPSAAGQGGSKQVGVLQSYQSLVKPTGSETVS